MIGSIEVHKRLRHAIGPTIGACVFGYFVFHAIQGERGLLAWIHIGQQLTESHAALAELSVERETIERRVDLLNSKALDGDLLEEQARVMLNMADPDDRAVTIPGSAKTSHGLAETN